MAEPSDLALFWAAVIAAAILIYVILDGFDLGVGILFGTTRDENLRGQMMASIAPYWDGNETWLVVIGASLFAAFPAAYAVFLGAFYIPVLLMLLGLIFRGVAFEFRYRSERMRPVWDRGFFLGSVVVAFVQGAAVGALMRGLPVSDMQYAGGSLSWLHPFPVLTGSGLVLGYALLGAGWLVLKTDGALHDWARRRVIWLGPAVLVVLAVALTVALTFDISTGLREAADRFDVGAAVLAATGAIALIGAVLSARNAHSWLPFGLTALFFGAAFLVLARIMWPYMIPYSLKVADAAAPEASLRFFFWGGAAVLPVIVAYTIGVYWMFRRKMPRDHQLYNE